MSEGKLVKTKEHVEWEEFKTQCSMAVASGLLPDVYNKGSNEQRLAKAMLIATKGKEIGIPMTQAFSQIHVISGKPAISSELMLALIYRDIPGAEINYEELSNTVCKIKARRGNGQWNSFAFSMDDAKQANLPNNPTWKKYPRAMLKARCIAEMARSLFPDAIMGCSYTPEELGAEVTENGVPVFREVGREDEDTDRLTKRFLSPEADKEVEAAEMEAREAFAKLVEENTGG
jgi:hypothetical protein